MCSPGTAPRTIGETPDRRKFSCTRVVLVRSQSAEHHPPDCRKAMRPFNLAATRFKHNPCPNGGATKLHA